MSLNLDKSHWKRVAFGDVVRNVNETVRDLEAAGIDRIVAMEHMDPGELKISRWGSSEDGTTFTRRVKPGQTLFGKRRAYQRKVAYAEFDAICSGDIYTFEADETQLLGELLPFLVQSNGFFEHALGTSAGSLSPRTNWRDLKDFEFDLPPLDEQKRIADLLWALERHSLALKSELHTIAFVRACCVDTTVFDDAAKTSLGEAAEVKSGVTLGPARRAMPNQAPYLRVANVQRGAMNLTEIKDVGATPAEIESKGLRRDDVLVVEGHASVDEIGRAAIWERDESPLFQNHLFRVRASSRFRPRFLLEWINSEAGRAYIRTVAKSTSGLNTINSTVLKALPIPAASLDQQDELLAATRRIDSGSLALRTELEIVTRLRDSILAVIFGGN